MRVLALGGAGNSGRHACRVAMRLGEVERIVIADLSASRAEAFAYELGPKAEALGLHAEDGAALRSAMASADVIMNTTGPFYTFGVPLLKAAIDARCNYIDICDDWEPTVEMLALDGAAREAGVTAVIGMGSTPGVSNLLAQLAVRQLDETRELVTGWNIEAAQAAPASGAPVSAAVLHGIRQMTGTIQVHRDGRAVEERPLRKLAIGYPGLGRRTVWTFGHPEPLTLPRTFGTVQQSVNVVHGNAAFLATARGLRSLIEARVLSHERAARVAQRLDSWMPTPNAARMYDADRLPPLFAYAAGLRDGREASVAAALFRPIGFSMGSNTGVPLAIGLELLARAGTRSRPGVFAPEAFFEASEVFERLRPHCVGAPSVEDIVVLTRSWDPEARERYREAIRAIQAVGPGEQARTTRRREASSRSQ